jgi:FolB domain-containing protein
MDRILIKDLLVRCVLGLSPEERREKQDVLISVALITDLEKPGRSDRFEDAVDYRAVKKDVLAAAESSNFHLVEALAEHVADICLSHQRVQRVQVTVEKPGALRFARSVAVQIERGRA